MWQLKSDYVSHPPGPQWSMGDSRAGGGEAEPGGSADDVEESWLPGKQLVTQEVEGVGGGAYTCQECCLQAFVAHLHPLSLHVDLSNSKVKASSWSVNLSLANTTPSNRASLVAQQESICLQCRRLRLGFSPWVGKIPWRRKWQPTPVFLPGKSHGQRSLEGYNPWGYKSQIRLCD